LACLTLTVLAGCPDYFPDHLINEDAAVDVDTAIDQRVDGPAPDRPVPDLPAGDLDLVVADLPDLGDLQVVSDLSLDGFDAAVDLCQSNWGFWSCAGTSPCTASCPGTVFPPLYVLTCDQNSCICTRTGGASNTCPSSGVACPSCAKAFQDGCCQGL
jgi:hypothetical protein